MPETQSFFVDFFRKKRYNQNDLNFSLCELKVSGMENESMRIAVLSEQSSADGNKEVKLCEEQKLYARSVRRRRTEKHCETC